MRLRPTPPAIPLELLDQFGEPEYVFGPNVRFRAVAAVGGTVLVVLGVYFFLLGIGVGGGKFPLSDWASGMLTAPLLGLGVVVCFGTMLGPRNWVFVCPQGLIRTRGDAWDGVRWADVDRFEDATLSHKAVAIRQCRIVLKSGGEWGFLADHIAEYRRLTELLRRKVDERRTNE